MLFASYNNVKEHEAFVEFHDLLAELEEKLSSTTNTEETWDGNPWIDLAENSYAKLDNSHRFHDGPGWEPLIGFDEHLVFRVGLTFAAGVFMKVCFASTFDQTMYVHKIKSLCGYS